MSRGHKYTSFFRKDLKSPSRKPFGVKNANYPEFKIFSKKSEKYKTNC